MSGKKNHINGGKQAGRHTTLTDFAEKVVRHCEKCPEVNKVVAGTIKQVKSSRAPETIKLVEEASGWNATIRGNTSLQTLHIYTRSKRAVAKMLRRHFEVNVVWSTSS